MAGDFLGSAIEGDDFALQIHGHQSALDAFNDAFIEGAQLRQVTGGGFQFGIAAPQPLGKLAAEHRQRQNGDDIEQRIVLQVAFVLLDDGIAAHEKAHLEGNEQAHVGDSAAYANDNGSQARQNHGRHKDDDQIERHEREGRIPHLVGEPCDGQHVTQQLDVGLPEVLPGHPQPGEIHHREKPHGDHQQNQRLGIDVGIGPRGIGPRHGHGQRKQNRDDDEPRDDEIEEAGVQRVHKPLGLRQPAPVQAPVKDDDLDTGIRGALDNERGTDAIP